MSLIQQAEKAFWDIIENVVPRSLEGPVKHETRHLQHKYNLAAVRQYLKMRQDTSLPHFHMINQDGRLFTLRLVFIGDKYGQCHALTHDGKEPYVEFYDSTFRGKPAFDELGQFVNRYYLSTFMNPSLGMDPEKGIACGLDLMGYEPDWKLDPHTVQYFKAYVTDYFKHRGTDWAAFVGDDPIKQLIQSKED